MSHRALAEAVINQAIYDCDLDSTNPKPRGVSHAKRPADQARYVKRLIASVREKRSALRFLLESNGIWFELAGLSPGVYARSSRLKAHDAHLDTCERDLRARLDSILDVMHAARVRRMSRKKR